MVRAEISRPSVSHVSLAMTEQAQTTSQLSKLILALARNLEFRDFVFDEHVFMMFACRRMSIHQWVHFVTRVCTGPSLMRRFSIKFCIAL